MLTIDVGASDDLAWLHAADGTADEACTPTQLAELDDRLAEGGAVLIRGLEVATTDALRRVIRALNVSVVKYTDGTATRTNLGSAIYTASERHPAFPIGPHNELSYSKSPPGRLFFSCASVAERGGQTILVDGAQMLRGLSRWTREAFERRGVRYLRTLPDGGERRLSWQRAFGTESRDEVMELCRRSEIVAKWESNGALSLTQLGPGTAVAPRTGQRVFFNQAHRFHGYALDAYNRIKSPSYDATWEEEAAVHHATFGDGEEIPKTCLEEIVALCIELEELVEWNVGDLLIVDNYAAMHGRLPYVGPRQVFVAMA